MTDTKVAWVSSRLKYLYLPYPSAKPRMMYAIAVWFWTAFIVSVAIGIALFYAPWSSEKLKQDSIKGIAGYTENTRTIMLRVSTVGDQEYWVGMYTWISIAGPSKKSVLPAGFDGKAMTVNRVKLPNVLPEAVSNSWAVTRVDVGGDVVYENDLKSIVFEWWIRSAVVMWYFAAIAFGIVWSVFAVVKIMRKRK